MSSEQGHNGQSSCRASIRRPRALPRCGFEQRTVAHEHGVATEEGPRDRAATGLAFPPGDGTTPRLFAGAEIAAPYARLVRSLEEKGIRTGYSDLSLSAPVTMFTGERIVLSPRLGPTSAYPSDRQEEMVARLGPDAYVLRADDDPKAFAGLLDSLGVTYRLDLDPVPIFYRLSRRVAIEEVAGFRIEEPAAEAPGDDS